MNYEEIAKKVNPFEGLQKGERKRMIVYLLYVSEEPLSIDEIRKRWGWQIASEYKLTVFQALAVAEKIRKEIASSRRAREWYDLKDRVRHFFGSGTFKVMVAVVVALIACVCGFVAKYRMHVAAEEQQKLRLAQMMQQAERHLPEIDTLIGDDPVKAVSEYESIAEYSSLARCRLHLCKALGIGCEADDKATLMNCCEVNGNCLGVAAQSPGFSNALSRATGFSVEQLRRVRVEAKSISTLKELDFSLLCQLARRKDKDAVREMANAYLNGDRVKRDMSIAKKYYGDFISIADKVEIKNLLPFFDVNGVCSDSGLLVKSFDRLAELGENAALFELGKRYCLGIGVKSNTEKGVQCFEKFIEWSGENDLMKVGDSFGEKGFCPNASLRMKTDRRLSQLGNLDAMVRMARRYNDGAGVVKDVVAASDLVVSAVKKGYKNFSADALLAYARNYGEPENIHLTNAMILYERSALMGNVFAQEWLGLYWLRQVPKNWKGTRRVRYPDYGSDPGKKAYETAVKWLSMAIDQGGTSASYMGMAELRERGSDALNDYRAAERLGSIDAAYKLGCAYETGLLGTVSNRAEAKKHYLIAAKKGDAYAQLKYAYLLDTPNEAIDWVLKSAKQGNIEAQYQCGRIYDIFGWGGRQERGTWKNWSRMIDWYGYGKKLEPVTNPQIYQDRAIYWYRIAAKRGHKEAEKSLSRHNVTLE